MLDRRRIDEDVAREYSKRSVVFWWKRRKLLLKNGRDEGRGYKTREMTARTSFTSFPEVSSSSRDEREKWNGKRRETRGSRFRSLTSPYVAVVNLGLFMRSSSRGRTTGM